jgi:glycerol-3-phosphate acyltransferase PlsX
MGGDYGPRVIVPAAVNTVSNYPNLQLILVGNRKEIELQLQLCGALNDPRLIIRETSQVVEMGDLPAVALRQKRDSSMRVAINLVKEGVAEACVSAGNTGALMAIARFVLKMLPEVDRPAIIYSLPSMKGHVHVLDLGANVYCEAQDLFQFAVMGSVLAMAVDNNPYPKVGLLNVGSEAIKGSEQVKKAAKLLTDNGFGINYVGFVEGDDIYKGTADVVVCDGFVGNVALKASEGLAKMIIKMTKEEFMRSWYGRCAALIAAPILSALNKRLDPNCYNGASLLGLKGIVIKSHGNAEQKAFEMAIRVAMVEVEKNIPGKIQNQLAVQLGNYKAV